MCALFASVMATIAATDRVGPFERLSRVSRSRGRLEHAVEVEEAAPRDVVRMHGRFFQVEHRCHAGVGTGEVGGPFVARSALDDRGDFLAAGART